MERLKLVLHHNDRVKLKCNGDQKCKTEHTEVFDCFLTASLKTTEMVRRLYDENPYGDLELLRSRTPRGEIEVPLSDRFLARLCFFIQQSEAYDTPRLEAAEDSGCRLLSRLGVPGYYYSHPTVPTELDDDELDTLLSIQRTFVAEGGGMSYLETSPATSVDPVIKHEHENPVAADDDSERDEVAHIYNFIKKSDGDVCCEVKWKSHDKDTEESFDRLKQDCPEMVIKCLLLCLHTNNVPKQKFYLGLYRQAIGVQDHDQDNDVKMEDA
ncbi:hypothetical protein HII31_02808 [Pseudocercospora fuligena]|uniref:Chromo domain-containing protein n=1 Tax=Pseudocercospora fuligena TaxID=685502 RepID=A0A8H6VKL6_9PEZI|nr:hypothetical protein HII31_02808 [Pseudocercospora fuligena]